MNRRSFFARLTGAIVASAVSLQLMKENKSIKLEGQKINPEWVAAPYETHIIRWINPGWHIEVRTLPHD